MKKFIYILFILPLISASCVDNKDEPQVVVPEPSVDLTIDNLVGTWETYYSEKLVNDNKYGYRTIDYDGFLTTYYKNGRFEDKNPFGELIFEGTFKILKNDTIEYRYVNKNQVDTVTKRNVSALKEKFLTTYVSATGTVDKTVYKITDIRIMRNIAKAAGEHPGIDKQTIDYSKLVGTWMLYDYSYYSNGILDIQISESQTTKYKWTKYVFAADKKITIYTPSDALVVEGTMKIVDDVIYIKDAKTGTKSIKSLKSSDNPQNPEEEDSYYIWLKNWKSDKDLTTFVDFDEFRNAKNITEIIKKEVIFTKQP